MLVLGSIHAHAKQYDNSCDFTFEKGVYSITQSCRFNFYEGETMLTYGDEPIDDTAVCTYNRDIGPMGYEEADQVVAEVYPKIFNKDNNPRVSGKLNFNDGNDGIDAYISLTTDGVEEGGEIFLEEYSGNYFAIGAMSINLSTPPVMKFDVDDDIVLHMNGNCSGPYFETPDDPINKHINTCTSLGFTKGTEKHGDCVMKLLG